MGVVLKKRCIPTPNDKEDCTK